MRLHQTALPLFALIAAAAPLAKATPTINVGSINLLPNTANQAVMLVVSGGDSVTGFKFDAVLGNGTASGAEPTFQAVGFGSPTIWTAHPATVLGGPATGAIQDAQSSIVFNTAGDAVAAAGNLVTLTIDTTGFPAGTSFPLNLKSTEIREDSQFIGAGGSVIPATITNGTINIVAVPEPTCPVLLGATAAFCLRRRRR